MVKLLGSLEKEVMSTFLATTHLATLCWGGEPTLSGRKQVGLEFLPRKGRAPWLCSAHC